MLQIYYVDYPHSILLKPILSDLFIQLQPNGELYNTIDENEDLLPYKVCKMVFKIPNK
jgi:hypothetical protein